MSLPMWGGVFLLKKWQSHRAVDNRIMSPNKQEYLSLRRDLLLKLFCLPEWQTGSYKSCLPVLMSNVKEESVANNDIIKQMIMLNPIGCFRRNY